MSTLPLNYAPPAKRRVPLKRLVQVTGALILLTVAAFFADQAITSLRLRLEARRLLAANAPAVSAPTTPLQFTSQGYVILPNGQPARFAEIPRAIPGDGPVIDAAVSEAMQTLRASRTGFTTVGAEPDGTPVVQMWVLTPRVYGLICGNSSQVARQRARMPLWRNVGAYLANEGVPPFDNCETTPEVSVVGW